MRVETNSAAKSGHNPKRDANGGDGSNDLRSEEFENVLDSAVSDLFFGNGGEC
jgi:hypothetical protein